MRVLRPLVAGLAGGAAWLLGLLVFFGPAQSILADPAYQSAKFLAVFAEIEPLPRMAAHPWLLYVGILTIGLIYGVTFAALRSRWPGRGWRRGPVFGLVAWALMVPWFEFYLPYNVMHEPFPLVLLEAVLWALVLQLVGIAIAGVDHMLARDRSGEAEGSAPTAEPA